MRTHKLELSIICNADVADEEDDVFIRDFANHFLKVN